jgi:hypothetical protein
MLGLLYCRIYASKREKKRDRERERDKDCAKGNGSLSGWETAGRGNVEKNNVRQVKKSEVHVTAAAT